MKRFALIVVVLSMASASAQDMPLSQVLIPGEGWKEVTVKGTAFLLTADGDGNPLVAASTDAKWGTPRATTDRRPRRIPVQATVWRLTKGGPEVFAKTEMMTAMTWHPKGFLVTAEDGLLYRHSKAKKPSLIHFKPYGVKDREIIPVADNIAIAPGGQIYFTIPADGWKSPSTAWENGRSIGRVGDDGEWEMLTASPIGGLVFWRDGGTLVVGDADGDRLVTYRVGKTKIDAPEGYYTLRANEQKVRVAKGFTRPPWEGRGPGPTEKVQKVSDARALALDADGRLYAATALGVQVFDPTGRMCGVLNSPVRKPVAALAFAGPGRDQLYVVCDGRLFVRKTKVKGFAPAAKKP